MLRLGYILSLGAFLPLDNFEFNIIAFLEAFVAFRLDGTVVDEHIRAVIATDEAEALCVIEPFDFTFDSGHVPCSTDRNITGCMSGPFLDILWDSATA